MIDEALAFAGAGLAVAREPRAQGARGQRVRAQGLQETSGVIGVGARQRNEHARGRPQREGAYAQRLGERLRQAVKQGQPATHPAYVAPAMAGHLLLGQALDGGQFPQPPGLLNRRPRPSLGAGERENQACGQIDCARLDADGIPPQAPQGGHTPIAVEQDKLRAPGEDCGQARLTLTIALQRLPQPLQGPGVGQPQIGIAQVQAVQVEFAVAKVGRGHAQTVAAGCPRTYHVLSLQERPPGD